MEFRKDEFQPWNLVLGVNIDGDAASIVRDADGITGLVQDDLYLVGKAVDVFIDSVIDDFPHEVMQSSLIDAADVHRRAFADRLESFQQLKIGSSIFFRSDGRHEFLSVLKPN